MEYTIDIKPWKKLKDGLIKLSKTELRVGWLDTHYGPDNENLPHAFVASLNEFGHTNGANAVVPGAQTPPRPYMRVGFRDYMKSGRTDQNFQAVIRSVLLGQNSLKALNQTGPYFVKALQNVMDSWDTPPNSRLTVEIKGFNNPLVKTHELIDKVTFEVAPVAKGD